MKRFTKALLFAALLGFATPVEAHPDQTYTILLDFVTTVETYRNYFPEVPLDFVTPVEAYQDKDVVMEWIKQNPKTIIGICCAYFLFELGVGIYNKYKAEKKRYNHPYFLDQSNSCLPDAVKQRDETIITKYSAKIEIKDYNNTTTTYTVAAPTFEQFKTALETQCKAPEFKDSYIKEIIVYPAVTFKETNTQQTGPIKIKKTKTVYLQGERYTATSAALQEGLTVTQAVFAHTLQRFVLNSEKQQIVFPSPDDQFYNRSGAYNITKNTIEPINN